MKFSIKIISFLVILLSLSSCMNPGNLSVDSPYFIVPVNSTLTLTQSLTIPAHTVGVLLQGGEVKSAAVVDRYHPNCRLEVSDLKETTQIVEPDTFTIYRVSRMEGFASRPIQLASSAGFQLADGGLSPENFTTLLFLRSKNQPNVVRLDCRHLEDPSLAQHLSVQQIKNTLGEIMVLEFPEQEN